jgi:hypothetical protein
MNAAVFLTGSEAVTLSAVAAMISKLLGWEAHPLQIAAVGREAYVEDRFERRAHSQSNPPTREFLEEWATTYPAMERGDTAYVDGLLGSCWGGIP